MGIFPDQYIQIANTTQLSTVFVKHLSLFQFFAMAKNEKS